MNDESTAVVENFPYASGNELTSESGHSLSLKPPVIPDYLQDTYWWAYLHPRSLWFFEREWVVNLILWGNMKRLTNAVLDETNLDPGSQVLQVACVYGDFSNRLASHLATTDSQLSIIDVAPIQLRNAEKKLNGKSNVSIQHQDSTCMSYADDSFEQTVVFFLLHEQPEDALRQTIAEALRVTRPGGRVIFVDYHGPNRSNPMRYLMKPVLTLLEPFAMALWRDELPAFLPAEVRPEQISSEFYFGGLYQKVVLQL
jgi:ubiquinone/menaquinone biosynthesis C-methylase UbiE